MCLAAPARVISVNEQTAVVDYDGVQATARLETLDEPVVPGDYVLVHAGFAIQRMAPEDAEATLRLFEELAASVARDPGRHSGAQLVTSHPFRFSDPRRARQLADAIRLLAPRDPVKLVHVCGTHEIAITRHGLRRLLPETVRVLEGPGCPVCVTPAADIETAIRIAERGAIVCSFGDMLRVPGYGRSLDSARGAGCDVRTVLSADEALRVARQTDREVVFFAVGFETTAPMTAAVALEAVPPNFSILLSHKAIPPPWPRCSTSPERASPGSSRPATSRRSSALRDTKRPLHLGGFQS